jgi:hypothetical protein
MGRRIIIGVLVLLLVGAGIYLFLLRTPVEAPSTAMAAVTIECDAWTGATVDGCRAWGDRLLASGPPSRTFNMEDLERLRLSGTPLGLGACRVAYYLGRDLDRPVWNEETDCAGG